MITKESLQKIKEYVNEIHKLNNCIIEKVVSAVCMIFNVDVSVFYTKVVTHDVTYARRMVWYILRTQYEILTKQLSDLFGYSKTHIRKSVAAMDMQIKHHKNIAIDYNQVMAVLR